MRKIIFPIILGISGVVVLLYLGIWQVQRLAWKEGILDSINASIQSDPIAMPTAPTEEDDEYIAVTVAGVASGEELHVLVSGTAAGTGYRVISAFEMTDGRRILLDLGLLALDAKDQPPMTGETDVLGNLIWPDEITDATPEPDLGKNIWFAREVVSMSDAMQTEPYMIVVRSMSNPDPRITPLPVDTSTIKNDHREYAITWFLLAVVWAAMTLYWIVRTTRQKDA